MDDYDARQYKLMISLLSEMEENEFKGASRLTSLKSLYSNLHKRDERWLEKIDENWWVIEEAYALALYEGRTEYNSQEMSLVKDSLKNIRALVESKLC